jgi:hypothetical protein
MTNKTIPFVAPKVTTMTVAIDNHMVIIHVQIGKNIVDDVILDGGFGVTIIVEQLILKLGLPKPKPTPYNLRMVNRITTKLMGPIRDLKIYVHNISYVIMFT